MSVLTSTEENKAVVYGIFEQIFNQGDIAALNDICSPNCILETPGVSSEQGMEKGFEAFKQRIISLRNAFPDLQYTIDSTIVDENKVAISSSLSGTHEGEFAGIAPTGKQIRAAELYFIHLIDGKIERIRLCPFGSPVIKLLQA